MHQKMALICRHNIYKYIQITDGHLKLPLFASLRTGHFTFFSDETQEQLEIYATFDHAGKISEHFIGILPLNKMVGRL